MRIFDGTRIPILSRAIDAYALRQRTIAHNLANITTTGYHARTVPFEEQLTQAMGDKALGGVRTNERHIPIGVPGAESAGLSVRERRDDDPHRDPFASGVNDVNLDEEMADLARNQIQFRFAARMLADTFRGLQKSIKGSL